MQSIVVGYMQSYPIGSIAIVCNTIIVWNYSSNCETCTILSSSSITIQSKVTGPCVCVVRCCCFNICNDFLSSYIRTNNSKVWECYHRQRFHSDDNIGALSTTIIVGYINMVSSCSFWCNGYNICIVRSSHGCIKAIVPYIIIIGTDTARIYSKCC